MHKVEILTELNIGEYGDAVRTFLVFQVSGRNDVAETDAVEGMLKSIAQGRVAMFCVVGADGRLEGGAFLHFTKTLTRYYFEVHDVFVPEQHRGEGRGEALMRSIISYVHACIEREQRPVSIQLTSNPERVAANVLYRKLGFALVATANADVVGGTNLYVLSVR